MLNTIFEAWDDMGVIKTWEKPQIQPGLFHRFPDLGHENGEQVTPSLCHFT